MSAIEQRGIALVTGTSSGIGAAYAARLARRGHDLILVARRRERLEKLADRIGQDHGIATEVLTADLSDPEDLRRVEDRAAGEERLTMLVNNAGIGGLGEFHEMGREQIRLMIDVNVTALTCLTRAVLPGMLNRRSGIIVNVASGIAFARMAGASVYAGTKAYVAQFSQALHEEVADKGIQIQTLIPGLTRTELGPGRDNSFFDQFPADMVMSPEVLVDTSLAGLELGELVCIPALEDPAEWQEADAAMQRIGHGVSTAAPAARYRRLIED